MADNDRIVFPDEVEALKEAQADATSGGDSNSIANGSEKNTEVEQPQEVPTPTITSRNVISVPDNCPPGYKMGPDGKCREVFD